ncbi:MAG TPA: hypothetical protein VMT18_13480, partial [Planctomycetota bacterium]|nr:hypothetical protein [Planctomycetota bacterium]
QHPRIPMTHSISVGARRLAFVGLLAATLSGVAAAQAEPPLSRDLRMPWDSGSVANTGAERAVVISKTVHVADADWLRVFFQHAELAGDPGDGTGSIVRITSFLDGAVQELDSVTLGQWNLSSAYMNGDTVQIDVEAAPGTGDNRLVLDRVTASLAGVIKSQCGPTDDRVLSSDPRSARVLPVGCSAWMFDDCKHCFGTAGHCSGSSLSVVQFNVPLSNGNGSLNNPPPEDQYSVDVSSKQAVNGGVGNDWGYFGVFPNSNTGLTPFQAQGDAYNLSVPPPFNGSNQIRITGYGTDSSPLTSNQVQQTHVGPWAAFGGTTLNYQADTTGGNSGSPVIHELTGDVIGVHTHGGCSTSGTGANAGTGANSFGWQAALASPKGVCQVQAGTSTYCTAKSTDFNCIPTISSVGNPSISGGPGSFLITSANQVNDQNGLMIYGTLPNNAPFLGGFLCVGGAVVRTGGQNTGGSSFCTGAYSFDMGGLIASGTDPKLSCGAILYAQFWTRDTTAAPPNNVNLTQGLQFEIGG